MIFDNQVKIIKSIVSHKIGRYLNIFFVVIFIYICISEIDKFISYNQIFEDYSIVNSELVDHWYNENKAKSSKYSTRIEYHLQFEYYFLNKKRSKIYITHSKSDFNDLLKIGSINIYVSNKFDDLAEFEDKIKSHTLLNTLLRILIIIILYFLFSFVFYKVYIKNKENDELVRE